MSLIPNTNLVVDYFNLPKRNPHNKYIYFLTHMHAGSTFSSTFELKERKKK